MTQRIRSAGAHAKLRCCWAAIREIINDLDDIKRDVNMILNVYIYNEKMVIDDFMRVVMLLFLSSVEATK